MDIQPPFAQKFEHFMSRTPTQYSTAPLSILADRGIENRLFENLVQHLPAGAIIAGGFVTSVLLDEQTSKDIDIFFTSEKAFYDTVTFIHNAATISAQTQGDDKPWSFDGYTLKDADKIDLEKLGDTRFITFVHPKRPALQLLRMVWYQDAAHVIDTFDLTAVQFAATKDGFTFNPISFLDLSRKRIVLHRMQFPASTMRRIIKYSQKGFYACPGSLANICTEIQKYSGQPDVNDVVYVD